MFVSYAVGGLTPSTDYAFTVNEWGDIGSSDASLTGTAFAWTNAASDVRDWGMALREGVNCVRSLAAWAAGYIDVFVVCVVCVVWGPGVACTVGVM